MLRGSYSISKILLRLPKWMRVALITVLLMLLGLTSYLVGAAQVLTNGYASESGPTNVEDELVTGFTFTYDSGPLDSAPITIKEEASEGIKEHQMLQETLNRLQTKHRPAASNAE